MHHFSLILSLILYANIVFAIPLDSRDEGSSDAYTGAGGQSPGGSVNDSGGLINVLSNMGGNGGEASSGSAMGGGSGRHGGHGHGNAYTGVGGGSPGGSVNRADDDDRKGINHNLNLLSGNGGNGGGATSGAAMGGGRHGSDCRC